MPRLLCLNIDQPEAQLFYGMKNMQSCSKCKRRKGYSAFRVASTQSGSTIQRLYEMAENQQLDNRLRRRAKLRLSRYGFNPKRRCLLNQFADKLLVRIPGQLPEVFPCLDYRDRMHGMRIFLHRELMTVLNMVLWESKPGLRVKEVLDQRLNLLGLQGTLRAGSRSYRILKTMFSDANMSATDKMSLIFLLPHVFGHACAMIPLNVRTAVSTAITSAQLMLVASRDRREYTIPELCQIFDEGYLNFFSALEHIHQVADNAKYNKQLEIHRKDPVNKPAPKRYRSDR